MKKMLICTFIVLLFNFAFLFQAHCQWGDTAEGFKAVPYYFVPLPPLTSEIKSEKAQMAGTELTITLYSSELSFKEIVKFYRERMTRDGWEELSPHSIGQGMIFKKSGEMVNIQNLPAQDPKKIVFSLSRGNIQSLETTGESSLSEVEFKDIPVYPNATSVPFSSIRTSVKEQMGYTTTDSVEKVMQFYREKLPAYGWKIENEMPLNEYNAQNMEDCPNCEKLPAESLAKFKDSSMKMAALNATKQGKSCYVGCTQVQLPNQAEQQAIIFISCSR